MTIELEVLARELDMVTAERDQALADVDRVGARLTEVENGIESLARIVESPNAIFAFDVKEMAPVLRALLTTGASDD